MLYDEHNSVPSVEEDFRESDMLALLNSSFDDYALLSEQDVLLMSIKGEQSKEKSNALMRGLKSFFASIAKGFNSLYLFIHKKTTGNRSNAKKNIAKLKELLDKKPLSARYNEKDELYINSYLGWFIRINGGTFNSSVVKQAITYEGEIETLKSIKTILEAIKVGDERVTVDGMDEEIKKVKMDEVGQLSLKTETILPLYLLEKGHRATVASFFRDEDGIILTEEFGFKIKTLNLSESQMPSKIDLLPIQFLITELNDLENDAEMMNKKVKSLFNDILALSKSIVDRLDYMETTIDKEETGKLLSSIFKLYRAVHFSVSDKFTLVNSLASKTIKYYDNE